MGQAGSYGVKFSRLATLHIKFAHIARGSGPTQLGEAVWRGFFADSPHPRQPTVLQRPIHGGVCVTRVRLETSSADDLVTL